MADASIPARPWWPYVIPMGAFLVLTTLEGYLPRSGDMPHPTWYPVGYAFKMVVVTALIIWGRLALSDLRPRPSASAFAMAVAIGLAVAIGWVLLERLPYPRIGATGTRQSFDPGVLPLLPRLAFLTVRFFGLVVLVPVIEELFWRSFLIRWLIDPDFGRVPIGQVTLPAAAISSVLFAAAHPEWLPALLTGVAWAWLLWRTRSLTACVVSHAVANLGLGLYILHTGAWQLW